MPKTLDISRQANAIAPSSQAAPFLNSRRASRHADSDMLPSINRRNFVAAVGSSMVASLAAADPDRPYTLVVPFPPGGGTDLIARSVAKHLSDSLSAPVVVDNRGGASGLLGVSALMQAPPDGQTLLLSSNSIFSINPALRPTLPYDPIGSFDSVGILGTSPLVILTKATSPWTTLKDFVASARQAPGALTYGSFGPGSVSHFAGELFKSDARVDVLHVPYKGSAPAMQDLLGGRISITVDTVTAATQHIRSGAVRCLAVTSATRLKNLPDVPTVAESGMPGYSFVSWVAVVTRRGVPAQNLRKLRQSMTQTLSNPAMIADLERLGLLVEPGQKLNFEALVEQEIPRYRAIAARASIKPDQ